MSARWAEEYFESYISKRIDVCILNCIEMILWLKNNFNLPMMLKLVWCLEKSSIFKK